jgi:hypothetical protein
MTQPIQTPEQPGHHSDDNQQPSQIVPENRDTTRNAKVCQVLRPDGAIVAVTGAADVLLRRALRFVGMGTRWRLWALT